MSHICARFEDIDLMVKGSVSNLSVSTLCAMVEENAGSTRSFLADGGEVENWNDDDDDDDDKCESF